MPIVPLLTLQDIFYRWGTFVGSGELMRIPIWVLLAGLLLGVGLTVFAWTMPKPMEHDRGRLSRTPVYRALWPARYLDVYVGGSMLLTVGLYLAVREWPIHVAAIGLGLASLVVIATALWPNVMHFVAMGLLFDAFGMRLVRGIAGTGFIVSFAAFLYAYDRPPDVITVALLLAAPIFGVCRFSWRRRRWEYIDPLG